MFYVYVLENIDGDFYTGFTHDLKKRLREHNRGSNVSTKNKLWHCIYYEACLHEADARRREMYLKTSTGRRMLKMRLKEHLLQKRRRAG